MDQMRRYFKESKTNSRIKEIVEKIKEYNPEKIILFGSRARGDNKKILILI